jgi:hypothetical protein
VELITGRALFQTHENMEHLAMMERVLHTIPVDMAKRASLDARKYFSSDNYSLLWSTVATRKSVKAVQQLDNLKRLLRTEADASAAPHLDSLYNLLKQILCFHPSDRLRARDCLEHHFFRERIRSLLPHRASEDGQSSLPVAHERSVVPDGQRQSSQRGTSETCRLPECLPAGSRPSKGKKACSSDHVASRSRHSLDNRKEDAWEGEQKMVGRRKSLRHQQSAELNQAAGVLVEKVPSKAVEADCGAGGANVAPDASSSVDRRLHDSGLGAVDISVAAVCSDWGEQGLPPRLKIDVDGTVGKLIQRNDDSCRVGKHGVTLLIDDEAPVSDQAEDQRIAWATVPCADA